MLLGTVETLPDALEGWTVHMDTVGSRRLTQAIPVLRANRRHLGSVVAIQMGNNYITGEDGDFASQLVTAMHIMRNVQRVVWVTVAKVSASRVQIDRDIMKAATRYREDPSCGLGAGHRQAPQLRLRRPPPHDLGRLAMARLIARQVGPRRSLGQGFPTSPSHVDVPLLTLLAGSRSCRIQAVVGRI